MVEWLEKYVYVDPEDEKFINVPTGYVLNKADELMGNSLIG